jgi:hypothetical protein
MESKSPLGACISGQASSTLDEHSQFQYCHIPGLRFVHEVEGSLVPDEDTPDKLAQVPFAQTPDEVVQVGCPVAGKMHLSVKQLSYRTDPRFADQTVSCEVGPKVLTRSARHLSGQMRNAPVRKCGEERLQNESDDFWRDPGGG